MRKAIAATMIISTAALTGCGKSDTHVYSDGKNTVAVANNGDGHMTVTGSNGEKMEFGAGAEAKMPSYLPLYPGAKVTASFTGQGKDGSAGMVSFSTSDAPEAVIAFYKQKAGAAGMADTMNMNSAGTTVYVAANEKAKTQVSCLRHQGQRRHDSTSDLGREVAPRSLVPNSSGAFPAGIVSGLAAH
ncbi:MAG: hypothetical protein WDM89_21440 [Rhizomicrobium sp.]